LDHALGGLATQVLLEVIQNYPNRNAYGHGWLLVHVEAPARLNKVNLSFWTSISRESQDPLFPIMNAPND